MNSLGNKEIMAKNIQYYLDKKGIDRNDMCRDLGFKYTTVSNWLQGVKYPRIDKIELMARYFGISKADLVEDHSTPSTPSEPEYTDEEKGIIRGYRKAPDDTKQIVRLALGKYMKDDAPTAPPKEQPKEAPKEEAPKKGKWGQLLADFIYTTDSGVTFFVESKVDDLFSNPQFEKIVEDTYKQLKERMGYKPFVDGLKEMVLDNQDDLSQILDKPQDDAVRFMVKHLSSKMK